MLLHYFERTEEIFTRLAYGRVTRTWNRVCGGIVGKTEISHNLLVFRENDLLRSEMWISSVTRAFFVSAKSSHSSSEPILVWLMSGN
jgi:hypothetical protein